MNINPSEGTPEPSESPLAPNAIVDRKEVFRVLVLLQDMGESVPTSRARVSTQFLISNDEVVGIEREGIAMNWPPLS
jgi:hypothetical protein